MKELDGGEVGGSGVGGLNAEGFPHLQAHAVAAASRWEVPSPARFESYSASFTRSMRMEGTTVEGMGEAPQRQRHRCGESDGWRFGKVCQLGVERKRAFPLVPL